MRFKAPLCLGLGRAEMAAHKLGHVLVKGMLRRREPQVFGFRPPARELQAHRAPAVADHHLRQQAVQLVQVARGQLVALVDEMTLELPRGAQEPRLQKRDQVEQLLEVVLHGGRRQKQDELLLDLAGKFPDLGVAIAKVMCLVHDDHVPSPGQDRRSVRLALGRMDRRDHAVELVPGARPASSEGRIVVADQLDRELAPHLPLPLLDQGRRHQNQDRADQPPDHQLRQDEARLDGLAQADLIAQHGPASEPPQDGLGRADLVLEQLDVTYQGQRDEPVEPGMRGQSSRLQRQVEVVDASRRLARLLDDGPVIQVENDGNALFRDHLAVGRLRYLRIDDQPETTWLSIFEPQGSRGRDDLGQLRG